MVAGLVAELVAELVGKNQVFPTPLPEVNISLLLYLWSVCPSLVTFQIPS